MGTVFANVFVGIIPGKKIFLSCFFRDSQISRGFVPTLLLAQISGSLIPVCDVDGGNRVVFGFSSRPLNQATLDLNGYTSNLQRPQLFKKTVGGWELPCQSKGPE